MSSDHVLVQHSPSTLRQPLPPVTTLEQHEVLTSICDRVLALGPGRLRIGIDGPTASGKTSFGHQLAEYIGAAGRPAFRACLDDFKRPWRDRHRADRETGEGYYRNAYDYGAVVDLLLEPSGPSGSGECALCSIDPLTQVDHSSLLTRMTEDAVLVVDGVFAFRPEIDRYWDLRIWLHVDQETSATRSTARDQERAGAAAGAVLRSRYLPAEQLYLAEVDPVSSVDVVVDNTDLGRPAVLGA